MEEGGGGGGKGPSVNVKVDPNDPGAQDEGSESGESSESGEGQEGEGSGNGGSSDKKPVFKVGDRARVKAGPLAGKTVEVTSASAPDSEGNQELQYAVVEDAA